MSVPLDIAGLLEVVSERGASDLHLTVGQPPVLRVDGRLVRLEAPPLTRAILHAMLYEIMPDESKARFEEARDLDMGLDVAGLGRFRVNVFLHRLGEAAVFRVIPSTIRTLDDLGLPRVLADLAMRDRGLLLVAGPTGAGKSTTLAAIVNLINEQQPHHIITIEDPIEFVHTPKRALINQREVGPHTRSFAAALASAMREDPDVLLVSELRDPETLQMVLTVAETGHLVLSALHANSAPQAIERIVDVFPLHQQEQARVQLAEMLLGVVTQILVPTADGSGRVAAAEMLVATSAVRTLIRESKVSQIPSVIQTGTKDGMQSLDQSLRDLVRSGRIAREEAARRAVERQAFLAADPGLGSFGVAAVR